MFLFDYSLDIKNGLVQYTILYLSFYPMLPFTSYLVDLVHGLLFKWDFL